MTRPHKILLLAVFAAMPLLAAAEIYKYVDSEGVTRYTDSPPSKDAKPIELPPLQTYEGGNDAAVEEPEQRGSILLPDTGGYDGVELVSPTPEQVFNNANPKIIASALVAPGLQASHRMVFLVDGLPTAAPPGQTSLELPPLERGRHTVQAVVMDDRDTIQIQSGVVSFQLNQPSALKPPPFNALPKPP